MHFTQQMMYMGFGCLLTLAGYILAGMNNDSVAQSGAQDVTFGTITCGQLDVVDDEGNKSVGLTNSVTGGAVIAYGKDGGKAQLHTDEHGGAVIAYGKDGGSVQLTNDEYGGAVVAYGKDGGEAELAMDEHGGVVSAVGKDGGSAALGIDEHGGAVVAEGKDGGLVSTNNKRHKNVLQVGLWMMVGCP